MPRLNTYETSTFNQGFEGVSWATWATPLPDSNRDVDQCIFVLFSQRPSYEDIFSTQYAVRRITS